MPTPAVPLFSHQYDVTCARCHSVIPHLNDFGAAIMASGYRIPGVQPGPAFPLAGKTNLVGSSENQGSGPNGAGLPKAIVDEVELFTTGAIGTRAIYLVEQYVAAHFVGCVVFELCVASGTPALADSPEQRQIDPARSVAQFSIEHIFVDRVNGTEPILSGSVTIPAGSSIPVSVTAVLDATRINSGDRDRDSSLESPDYFDTKNLPTWTLSACRSCCREVPRARWMGCSPCTA
jgi:hypothetical protein